MADRLVTGVIVTMDARRRVIEDGAVAIAGDRIVAVGDLRELAAAHPDAARSGGPDAIVLPGFIDCHSHSTQALLRGLVAGEWPMIYRLYIPGDMALAADEAATASAWCAAQLLRSGVTTVCDFQTDAPPETEDAVLDAIHGVGLRVNLLRSHGDQHGRHAALYSQISERSSREVRVGAAEADLERTEALLARHRDDPMTWIGVCPSNLLSFSDTYFREAHALACASGARLHVHAARDREEVEFCLAVFGRRPVERLADLGVLDHRTVIVHGMLASAREARLMAEAWAGLAHSAIEVANILARVPDVPALRAQGVRVGLGCDNAVNDMWEVMRAAWLLHLAGRGIETADPAILPEADVLAMATCEAAAALGLEQDVGSLEVGKRADLQILDGGAAHLGPVQDLLPELVRNGTRAEIREVFVGGRRVLAEGRPERIDLPALRARANGVATRLAPLIAPRRYTPTTARRLCC
jgi:5-methylthioadenosine/S-adenosylhomocysteine deaminase